MTAAVSTPLQSRSVSEAEGWAATGWEPSGRPCRRCKAAGRCYSRVWESDDGASTDEQHECRSCGAVWWVEGGGSWLAGVRPFLAAILRRLGHRPGG
jgi:hypothetical protein